MIEHRALGRRDIAAADRRQNPLVIFVRARGPPRRADRLLAALREGFDEGVHGDLAHERPFAGTYLDETYAFQRAERLPHRGPTHEELLGEITLRGELIAALETTFGDHPLDLADDLLVDARRFDRGEIHASRQTFRRPAPLHDLRHPPGRAAA